VGCGVVIIMAITMGKEDEKYEEQETIADFTNVREGGVPLEEVLKHVSYVTKT
jgi:hypothetical protein